MSTTTGRMRTTPTPGVADAPSAARPRVQSLREGMGRMGRVRETMGRSGGRAARGAASAARGAATYAKQHPGQMIAATLATGWLLALLRRNGRAGR